MLVAGNGTAVIPAMSLEQKSWFCLGFENESGPSVGSLRVMGPVHLLTLFLQPWGWWLLSAVATSEIPSCSPFDFPDNDYINKRW